MRLTRRSFRTVLSLAAAAFLLSPGASAYYHFIRFATRNAPYQPVPEKFDLASLPDRTVPFFISEQGPDRFAAGDTFAAVVSQLRAAARVWSEVETSDLRLSFGGLQSSYTVMNSPGIEVIFTDDLPPGIVALGGPVVRTSPVNGPNGQFAPIVRSQVRLNRNMEQRASWGERFFLTVVHEFGHALGLQHTWTSSVMSTEITRATTKAKPLGADDIAGLSALYPGRTFASVTGVISGRVTLAGAGVNLASVVAMSTSGAVVSALTNPDGSYRIEGVPPGLYSVYAHPLPPSYSTEPQPVNLVLPSDPDRQLLPGAAFDTQFYPNSRSAVPSLTVTGASLQENINFNVQQRSRVNIFGVQAYSFLGQEAIKPAHLSTLATRGTIVFTGSGLMSATGPLPGLEIGGASATESLAAGGARYYSPSYLQLDVLLSPFSSEGPRHLTFSLNNELYVLPAAFAVVQRGAPSLNQVVQNPDRSVTLAGPNLGPLTRIWFDGVQATVRSADEGRLTVIPPPAPAGHRATLAAFNPDGQSSIFVHGANSPSYTYDNQEPHQLTVSPLSLPVGVETAVEVSGSNLNFSEGLSRLGFGNSDIVVRRLWVLGPSRAVANVSVALAASPGISTVTMVSGLNVAVAGQSMLTLPANTRQAYVNLSSRGGAGWLPGATAVLALGNFVAGSASGAINATLADRPILLATISGTQVSLPIPTDQPPGPALLRLSINGEAVLPIYLPIDAPPPVILSASLGNGTPVQANNAPQLGEVITLLVSGLGDPVSSAERGQLKVSSGGVDHSIQRIQESPGQPGVHVLQVQLSSLAGTSGPLQLTVSIDGRASAVFPLPIRPF